MVKKDNSLRYRLYNAILRDNDLIVKSPATISKSGKTAQITKDNGLRVEIRIGMLVRILVKISLPDHKVQIRYTYAIGKIDIVDQEIRVKVPEKVKLPKNKEYSVVLPEHSIIQKPTFWHWLKNKIIS